MVRLSSARAGAALVCVSRASLLLASLILASLLLAGCDRVNPEPEAAEYLLRLGRTLEVELVARVEAPGPAWPVRRDLLIAIPRAEIDVGEFVDLHGCDMGALIGFRNSPLGRVQRASQRLGYEAAWLAAARGCGARAPEWLQERVDAKAMQLPALYWNALIASDEMRVAAGASLHESAGDFATVLETFSSQYDALERGAFDLVAFEAALAILGRGSWIGPARKSWAEWRASLDVARAALDHAGARICRNGRPTPRSRHLANVFARFYIGSLQPRLAARMQVQGAWIRALADLNDTLRPVARSAFHDWFTHVLDPGEPQSEWQRTRRSVVAHAAAWQRLFETCGIDPRSTVGQD